VVEGTANRAYAVSLSLSVILGLTAMVAISMTTAIVFTDKLVFEREQRDELYSVFAHFLARLLVGLPSNVLVAVCLVVPAYFWVGLRSDGITFFYFLFVLSAVVYIFVGVVNIAAYFAKNVNTAYSMANFYNAISIIVAGVFVPYPALPPVWQQLYFVFPFGYAFSGAAVNEFAGTPDAWWLVNLGTILVNKWLDLVVLVGMGLAFSVIEMLMAYRASRLATHVESDSSEPDPNLMAPVKGAQGVAQLVRVDV